LNVYSIDGGMEMASTKPEFQKYFEPQDQFSNSTITQLPIVLEPIKLLI